MKFYLAPMEGLTGYVVRNAFYHNFDSFDAYFTPFIPAGKRLHKKMQRDVNPDNNTGLRLIPQILCNHAEDAIELTQILARDGYKNFNMNLGCPSGTVSNKGRGSGFLQYPDELERFLDEIYSHTDFTMSVKTRVGFHDDASWERLVEMYKKYPRMTELIIHPRTQKDFYNGALRMEKFSYAMEQFADSPVPICYNGDINTLEDYIALKEQYPTLDRVMIGRGAFRRPGLINVLRAWEEAQSSSPDASTVLHPKLDSEDYRRRLRNFHDEILEHYGEAIGGQKDVLFRMKEIWSYLNESFEDSDKLVKKIKKAQNMDDYRLAVEAIFRDLELGEI